MKKCLSIMFVTLVVVISLLGCNISDSKEATAKNTETKTGDVGKDEPLDVNQENISTEEISTEKNVEEEAAYNVTIYTPNENVDGLVTTQIEIQYLNEAFILDELISAKVVLADTKINKFEKREDKGRSCITVDFNDKLAELLYSCGTSGEYVVMASLVNTYLEAYNAELFEFTINGQVFESGHVIYDEPIGFFTMNN